MWLHIQEIFTKKTFENVQQNCKLEVLVAQGDTFLKDSAKCDKQQQMFKKNEKQVWQQCVRRKGGERYGFKKHDTRYGRPQSIVKQSSASCVTDL